MQSRASTSAEGGSRETRGAILQAAVEVLAREGVHGARVEEIAAIAGVSPGLLNYHFGSRQELLRAALISGLQRRALPEDRDGVDALTVLSGGMVPEGEPAARGRSSALDAWWRLRSEALRRAVFDVEIRAAVAEASEVWAGYLAESLPRGRSAEEQLDDAWTLIALADGLRQRVASGLMPASTAARTLSDALDRITGVREGA